MPTGRLVLTPEAEIQHVNATPALDAFDPTDVDFPVPQAMARGGATTGVPDVIDQVVGGRRWRLWDQVYFGIIHVIPRKKDVGAVISEVTYPVEVWNADEVAHQATSVAITGSSGVSLSGGPTLPAYWAPFSSHFIDVVVDAEGSPVIDTLITWIFPGFDGTDHQVVGFRLTVYPLPPLWDQGFQDAPGWLTDVLRAYDATEQRRQLLGQPLRELSYVGFSADPVLTAEIMLKLMNAGHFVFGTPYWPDAVRPTADVAAGAAVIQVDTTSRIFQAGGQGMLWQDERIWEAFTIQSLTASSLTLAGPTAGAFLAGRTYVIPVLSARLLEPAQLLRPAPGKAEIRVRFLQEPV